MNPAVFLDRDGVINHLILNPITNDYEAPHTVEDFKILPFVIESLLELQQLGFMLFLISNQPDFALGKTTLENILSIQDLFNTIMSNNHITFAECFYCYHHPNSLIPEYFIKCECRKPNPYFIQKAYKAYHLNLKKSWIIGDQDTDIICGQHYNLNTILLNYPYSNNKRGNTNPSFYSTNLKEAVKIIKNLI